MSKITDQKFINFFEKKYRNLDEVYEEHKALESYIKKKTIIKMNSTEAHKVGSVVFNLEIGIEQYRDMIVYKFKDIINSIIISINAKSYSGAYILVRALMEHFAMFALKINRYSKLIHEDNYLKLSKELIYWGISADEASISPTHKRTHIMDAIRFLKDYFYKHWKEHPDDSESYYEDLYSVLSNFTHPASDSLLIYTKDGDEKYNSSGYEASINYSNDVDEIRLDELAYVFNIVSNFLVTDLLPEYNKNVADKFNLKRENTVKFFSINPDYAKEILDLTVDKKKIDEKRKKMGLDDIDKIRYENFKIEN